MDTKELPANGFYRAMVSGHLNRRGHLLEGYLLSTDGGQTWNVERTCCATA